MIQLATASILGREHARLLKNNQDGVAARVEGNVAVAVVTDGCGSGASSEVGARLGARFLAQALPGLVREVGVGPVLAGRATAALLKWVEQVVRPLDVSGAELPALVGDQFLFTFLCAVMDERSSLIFGVGDGAWCADGEERVLDPGEGNAPDYVAYGLVGVPVGTAQVHFWGEAQQLAVATDGLAAAPREQQSGPHLPVRPERRPQADVEGPSMHSAHPSFDELRMNGVALAVSPGEMARATGPVHRDERFFSSFFSDGLVWRNPAALQRRLNVRSKELFDDTTVALMKRSA